MLASRPRAVIVTRKTPLETLIERRGTRSMARFYLKSRRQDSSYFESVDERYHAGLTEVLTALPADWRRARVDRDELDRFLFAPDDTVIVVGQDGLVANVAKYVRGQPVLGINPDPASYDGVLCPHAPPDMPRLLCWLQTRNSDFTVQPRVTALAERDDGQTLRALNEVFVGHRTHQSARYRIRIDGKEERQSSSGVICSTGTGCTGWARSIAEQRGLDAPLPGPTDRGLVWFVREPFPSVATGTSLSFGRLLEQGRLMLTSEMGEGGVLFADGIESDTVEFLSGQSVTLRIGAEPLMLVVPAARAATRPSAPRAARRPEARRGRRGAAARPPLDATGQ